MTAGNSGYVIGITLYVNGDGSLGFFENGLRQNVLFLHRLFSAAPGCARAYLLNHGDAGTALDAERHGIDPADIVRTEDVADALDFVIVAGAAIDPATAGRLRERGCRLIAYKCGNGAVISMEAVVARPVRGDAERYFDRDIYDAVWITPQHWRTCRGWYETLYRCPAFEVPHIWEPWFVEQAAPEVRAAFGYRPGRRPWRAGILDPSITVMKTSHVPMLVCAAAYADCAEAFAAIYVTNAWPHRENPHFAGFAGALAATCHGRMSFEPRFVGIEFIARHCDAVVTHQWENDLNYLYYEALHGGYPLVHNSGSLDGCGYRYPDFDCEAGGAALLEAWHGHDDGLAAYRERAASFLAKRHPREAAVARAHEALLVAM